MGGKKLSEWALIRKNGHLSVEKRQKRLKTQHRDASYQLKSKVVVI